MGERRVTNSYESNKANELEIEGWLVIREFEQGRPDVIALRKLPGGGWEVKVREFKGVGTKISNEQARLIKKLRDKGVDADFTFEQDEPASVRL